MSNPLQITNRLEIQTRQEFRSWLMDNHDKMSHAWIPVLSKDPEELSYLAVVEESLCLNLSCQGQFQKSYSQKTNQKGLSCKHLIIKHIT